MKLVLLPGLACDARMWRAQVVALASLQPVVSDVHFRHDTIAAMAAALLEEHEGPLALCGASMGGMVAMEACCQAPQRIARLALLGTNARPESDEMRQLRTSAIAEFEQGRLREVIEPNIAFAFHSANAADPRLREDYLDLVLDAGAAALIRQNRAVMTRPDARKHLPGLCIPTLVLCGDSDQLTPPECSEEIAALVPNSRLHFIARCGHMLTMEQPEAVNAHLQNFFS